MSDHHGADKKAYESYELHHIKPILLATASIVAVAALSFVAMLVMLLGMEKASLYFAEPAVPMTAYQKPYDGLMIQAVPPAELSEVQSEANKILSEYGWVDKNAQVVHLPINRAMELVLQRGFPVRSSNP